MRNGPGNRREETPTEAEFQTGNPPPAPPTALGEPRARGPDLTGADAPSLGGERGEGLGEGGRLQVCTGKEPSAARSQGGTMWRDRDQWNRINPGRFRCQPWETAGRVAGISAPTPTPASLSGVQAVEGPGSKGSKLRWAEGGAQAQPGAQVGSRGRAEGPPGNPSQPLASTVLGSPGLGGLM